MKIEKSFDSEKNAWVFRPFGYIDLYNAPVFRAALEEARNVNIILSCEELAYIDSAGLTVLRDVLQERQAAGCFVKICRLRSYLYRIFELTGFHKVFDIQDVEEAE